MVTARSGARPGRLRRPGSEESWRAPAAVPPGTSSRVPRLHLLSAAAIVLVCLLAYGGSLRHGFVSDDLHLIVDRLPDYQQRIPWAEAFTRSFWKGGGYGALPGEQKDYYRPLVTLSYALDARVWGGRPSGYHWTNLCLHILASFLVWRFLMRLVGRPAPALAAALVFAAHPIHVASVAWISGRTDLLCAVFLLAAYDRVTMSLDERMGIAARGSPRRISTT